jgi:F-type H+-transporting ATPase subunit delta
VASVASTYARAFADVVFQEHLDTNRAIGGLHRIAALMEESEELRRVWENPAVPADQKRRLLDAIVHKEGIEPHVRNLVAILIDHRRMHFLESIAERLQEELNTRLGFAEAQITSARELGDSEKQAIEAQVGKLTGRKVRARFDLDSSLLGGVVVRVGGTIYDGSVKGQLERIKAAISA